MIPHRLPSLCRTLGLLILAATMLVQRARAEETPGADQAARANGQHALAKLLQQYCFDCHGADTQEGNLRFDTLVENPRAGALLEKILGVVGSGRMPPEDAEPPSREDRSRLVSAIEQRLTELTDEARRSGNRTRNRRLTVEEYHFTMQSLFRVDAEFADMLPPDPIAETGYRNDSGRLGLSSLQIEAYLDSARRAVGRYVQFGELKAKPLRYQIEFEDLFYSTADRYGTRQHAPKPIDLDDFVARRAANLASKPRYVDPLGPALPGAYTENEALRAAIPKLNQQYVALPQRLPVGELIVRVRAAGTADRGGRFPRMRVEAGITLGDGCSMNKRLVGETDVTAPLDDPETYEFRVRLEDVPTKGPLDEEESFDRLSVFDMDQLFIANVSPDSKAIFALGRGGYSDPATGSERIAPQLEQMGGDGVNFLHLDCVEIEMFPGVGAESDPYHWRIASEAKLDGQQQELAVAKDFLSRFMQQAYRRPVAEHEIDTKLDLFNTLRKREYPFEESLRETLVAVLVSPSFLFLESKPPGGDGEPEKPVTPHQLAARLSYLLWLSPPDEPLRKLADNGSLQRPEVFRREAERLLADPRSRRFLESFCRQWLRLDKHANVAVDREAYPTWDEDLAADSLRETLAYFVEVFESDASALDLIDSDYAILNDRLARHYNAPNVTKGSLHRVALPEDSVRGGLLVQASLLTMNSDGVDSHPVRRGVWLLERMLNQPPPPPPPNVPEIDVSDPDFRGLSLKERIELHRDSDACRNCHQQIDPWGIALENFDATGRWRDKIDGRGVDASAVLPSGERVDGIADLKRHLRQQRAEQFAHALVYHLLTYALGRSPDYADRKQVAEIQDRFAASEYRIKELVLAIVESETFRN